MKFVRIMHREQPCWGVVNRSMVRLFHSVTPVEGQASTESSNDRGLPSWITELAASSEENPLRLSDMAIPLADAQFLTPIGVPEKIICIGTNYAEHAREMGGAPPALPVVFSKFPSALLAPRGEIVLPPISQKVDFEAELVVVIGREGKNIPRSEAMQHVFGYCCGNDISARDWQKEKPGGQWLLGKTFDTFAPVGPMIVTADEIADPHQLKIQLRLNDVTMQESSTSELIFPVDYLISHLSQFFRLRPGDLIFTGTPPGVGAGRTPPVFLQPGDRLEVEIEHLGILNNQVVAAGDS